MKRNIKHFSFKEIRLIIGFILSLALFYSCVKKEDFDFNRLADNELEQEWASSLINSHLTIDKMVNDSTSIIQTDPTNGFITLVFQSSELWSKRAEEMIVLPQQDFNLAQNNVNLLDLPLGVSDSISFTMNYNFSSTTADQRIDSIAFKNGSFDVNLSSNINHNCDIEISILNLKQNGQIFTKLIHYVGTIPVPISESFDITGYTLKPNNVAPAQNEIQIRYKIKYTGDGNPNNSPYFLNLTNQMNTLHFSKMFGYFGQLSFTAQDTFHIEIFENNYTSYFDLVDMKAKLYTWNSIGMPVNFNVNELYGTSSVNPPYLINVSSTIYNPLIVPYPTLLQFGQTIENVNILSSSNSNINQVMNISPRKFIYNVTGTTNPAANPNVSNFLIDTSRFGTKLKIEIPLWGKIKGFSYQDTIEFKYDRIDQLESILFRVNATNGFPVDAHIQIYFVDSAYVVKDSLLNPYQQMVYAGIIGPAPDLKVQTPTYKLTDILLEGDRLKNINGIKYIFLRGELWSYNYTNTDVKIYMDNALDLKIGAKAKFKVNFH